MPNLNRIGVAATTAAILMIGATFAYAEVDAAHDAREIMAKTQMIGDTQINLGYDTENHIFAFGTSELDGLYDCTLDLGVLAVEYGNVDETITIESLIGVDGPVKFANRGEEALAEGLESADEPLSYDGDSEHCALSAAAVSGPNGQVNHGQFMKTFNELVDGKGRGCLVKHLAQSDFGKGDQQIKSSQEDADASDPISGFIEFDTAIADCQHGAPRGSKKSETKETPGGGGQGKAKGSKGKSESAPGKSK